MITQTTNKEPLYVADANDSLFDSARKKVKIVCAGDSITGWNNVRAGEVIVPSGPYTTYPLFLQRLVPNLRIADCGIAGAFSPEGIEHVSNTLNLFPNSKYFVIGYGTNDLALTQRKEDTSKFILDNLELMTSGVLRVQKKPILINVPYINSTRFSTRTAQTSNAIRDYHNAQLKRFCEDRSIPLVDICSKLRDEHLADALHTNEEGAKIIAQQLIKHLI